MGKGQRNPGQSPPAEVIKKKKKKDSSEFLFCLPSAQSLEKWIKPQGVYPGENAWFGTKDQMAVLSQNAPQFHSITGIKRTNQCCHHVDQKTRCDADARTTALSSSSPPPPPPSSPSFWFTSSSSRFPKSGRTYRVSYHITESLPFPAEKLEKKSTGSQFENHSANRNLTLCGQPHSAVLP